MAASSDVVEDDFAAGLERDLTDPGAHRAGADDADDGRQTVARRPPGALAHQTGFDRFERLAAVGAVADAPTLRRPEEVLDHRSSRAAMRARDARFEVDETARRARRRIRARWRDPGGEEGGPTGGTDPLGRPRDLERGRDLDRASECTQPFDDRRRDELERRATDERRQDRDADRAATGRRPRRRRDG
jgi:hypothetical protein